MTTLNQKLQKLELRVKFMGEHKTSNTRRAKENYLKDLKEIPNLINDLAKEIQPETLLQIKFDNAVASFKYWKE